MRFGFVSPASGNPFALHLFDPHVFQSTRVQLELGFIEEREVASLLRSGSETELGSGQNLTATGVFFPTGNPVSSVTTTGVARADTGSSGTLQSAWSTLSGSAMAQVQAASNSAAVWDKLQFGLAELYAEAQIALSGLVGEDRIDAYATFSSSNALAPTMNGYVALDIVAADGKGASLLPMLEALGFKEGSAFGPMVGGLLPIDAIDDLAALDGLAFARPAYAMTSVGSVTARDGQALGTTGPLFAGLDGSGLMVGVLSDSFDRRGGAITYATDIATGDLPAGILILDDSSAGGDEGRAMAQLIYDIAPGAKQAFHTAFTGQANFAQGILDLAAAGADIIVDDVFYFAEPFFQDGVIAQAVDTVDAMGIPYLSSAGNHANNSYESAFVNSGTTLTLNGLTYELHDFDPGAGVDTRLSITQSGAVNYIFQWDESFFSVDGTTGATNNINIFALIPGTTSVIASSTINNVGGDPIELLRLSGNGTFDLVIGKLSGTAPGLMKLVNVGGSSTINEHATNSSTSFGHANAKGAIAVAAAFTGDTPAFGKTPPLLENFSSKGGTPILFDTAGNRLSSPENRNNVDFTSTDGGNTTFFGSQIADGDTFPNFFGTSAAAPTAAAVFALLKQAVPTATTDTIEAALKSTAIDIVNRVNGKDVGVGYDVTSGAGLIQADRALIALRTINGDNTAETLIGTDGQDFIVGNGGNDIILGLAGDDVIGGGDGDDTIFAGDGNDALNGGAGDDLIYGGEGNDRLAGGDNDDRVFGEAGDDTIQGGNGNDRLFGGVGNDKLTGEQGVDQLYGEDGADILDGGSEDDFLSGGADRDYLVGGTGNDTLDGGSGSDILEGGLGLDNLIGGTGADFFLLRADQSAGDADTIFDFETGVDRIGVNGAGGKVIEFRQSGANTDIFSDNVFVARVMNTTAADVKARTLFDQAPASSTVLTASATTGNATLGAPEPAALTGLGMDAAFQFLSAPVTQDTGAIFGTAGYDQMRIPMTALFADDYPVLEPQGPADISLLNDDANVWMHSMFNLEPLI